MYIVKIKEFQLNQNLVKFPQLLQNSNLHSIIIIQILHKYQSKYIKMYIKYISIHNKQFYLFTGQCRKNIKLYFYGNLHESVSLNDNH